MLLRIGCASRHMVIRDQYQYLRKPVRLSGIERRSKRRVRTDEELRKPGDGRKEADWGCDCFDSGFKGGNY